MKYQTSSELVIREQDAKILILTTGDIIESNSTSIAWLKMLQQAPLSKEEILLQTIQNNNFEVSVNSKTLTEWISTFIEESLKLKLIISCE